MPSLFIPLHASIRFCCHQVEGKVSLLSLPPPFSLAEAHKGARLHCTRVHYSQLKCSGRLCWGCHNSSAPSEMARGFILCLPVCLLMQGQQTDSSCQELKSRHVCIFGTCREDRVLIGGAWRGEDSEKNVVVATGPVLPL